MNENNQGTLNSNIFFVTKQGKEDISKPKSRMENEKDFYMTVKQFDDMFNRDPISDVLSNLIIIVEVKDIETMEICGKNSMLMIETESQSIIENMEWWFDLSEESLKAECQPDADDLVVNDLILTKTSYPYLEVENRFFVFME